jgi:signal transduction histidine kinase
VVLRAGEPVFADPRALEMLACAGLEELKRRWSEVRPDRPDRGAAGAPGGEARRLTFDLHQEGDLGVMLVQDAEAGASLLADLCLSSLMRSLSQITPAVAHDLRAPINAMVFNIEVLKETIASGRGAEPAGRERQLRYVNVLKEELHRLHRGMENYIAQISPRGDRDEVLDLREPLQELAELLVGPARKQQVKVASALPETPVMAGSNRYLLRQALLHLSLATLGTIPRDGTLEIALEPRGGKARIRLSGTPGAAGGAGPEPAPGFDVRPSAKGTVAGLWVARAILAAYGGEARAVGPEGEGMTGGSRVYEVELTISENPSNGNKGVR